MVEDPGLMALGLQFNTLSMKLKQVLLREEILEDKPHLTLAGIYTAIAYYYANKESLDAEFAEYDQECDRFIAEYTTGNTNSQNKSYK